jgi:hypothetical protein
LLKNPGRLPINRKRETIAKKTPPEFRRQRRNAAAAAAGFRRPEYAGT